MSVFSETTIAEPEKEKLIPTPIEMNSYECQQEPVSTIDINIIAQKNEYLNTPQKNHWETPIPFKNINLPNFPVSELPVVISDYVRSVAETTQTSPDMAATASLAILALSLQGKFLIEGKKDWREPLNLYTIVIAPPAERKSAVMTHMIEPLKRYETTENERLAPLIEQNKIDKTILEKKKRLMEDTLAKGKIGADRSKIRELSETISEFKEIKPCRLFCDDITSEKLASVLFDNDGKTALLSSEGGIFDMLAGRYSGGVNIDVFLKAHSGDSIRVDRQGRQSEYIQNPTMTTLLFAQPNVIESIMSNGVFHGRGLCARFLYSIPNSTVGRRKFESRPISDIISDRYYNLINILLNIKNDSPKIISLSSRAYELLSADELRRFGNEFSITKAFIEKHGTMVINNLSRYFSCKEDIIYYCVRFIYDRDGLYLKEDDLFEIFTILNNTYFENYPPLRNFKNKFAFIPYVYYLQQGKSRVNPKLDAYNTWFIKNMLYEMKDLDPASMIAAFDSIYQIRQKQIFVAMPFEERLDFVFDAICEAVKRINDDNNITLPVPIRIDKQIVGFSYDIVNEILDKIENCGLLIADLTGQNANVYYEAGFAQGLIRARLGNTAKILYLISDQKNPDEPFNTAKFDVNHYKLLPYKDQGRGHNDLKANLEIELKAFYGI